MDSIRLPLKVKTYMDTLLEHPIKKKEIDSLLEWIEEQPSTLYTIQELIYIFNIIFKLANIVFDRPTLIILYDYLRKENRFNIYNKIYLLNLHKSSDVATMNELFDSYEALPDNNEDCNSIIKLMIFFKLSFMDLGLLIDPKHEKGLIRDTPATDANKYYKYKAKYLKLKKIIENQGNY